ncbi:MAG TPA: hypothetical protein VF678_11175, partial [bacterium]
MTSLALPGRYPRLVLMVMASVLLLSGCMLSPLFQAPAAVMTGIAVLLGLAACGGGGGGGGGGGDTSPWPKQADLRALYAISGLGVIFGGTGGEDLGFSLSAGQEVNGDTNNDLVIGAPNAVSGKGRAYVVFGGSHMTTLGATMSAHGMSDLTTTQHGIILSAYDGNTGTAVLLAPSLGGDSLADIVVGSPYYAGSSGGQGRVSVVFGSSTLTPPSTSVVTINMGEGGLTGTNGFSVRVGSEPNTLGMSLAAGDLTGDSLADLLMGAPYFANTSVAQPHVTLIKGSISLGSGFVYDNAYSAEGGTATGKWMEGAGASVNTGVGTSLAISGDGFAVVGLP